MKGCTAKKSVSRPLRRHKASEALGSLADGAAGSVNMDRVYEKRS